MSHIEDKYIGHVSSRLTGIVKRNGTWNFRCPICGDSKKSKSKKRGFLLPRNNTYVFYCHNDGASMSFQKFLEALDPVEADNYKKDLLFEKYGPRKVEVYDPKEYSFSTRRLKNTLNLTKVSQLPPDHPCKVYVQRRMIPNEQHYRLYFASEFMKYSNTLLPGKFSDEAMKHDGPRLIIPFIGENGDIFGYQGRALDPDDKIRYITIMLDDTQPKFFGLHGLDRSKRIYVTEGPIDSMFLPNAIAPCGGVLTVELKKLGLNVAETVIVYDNEPHNKDTVRNINKAIVGGYRVVIWPKAQHEKDVNDLYMAGKDPLKIIDEHTYMGLKAQLAWQEWKK